MGLEPLLEQWPDDADGDGRADMIRPGPAKRRLLPGQMALPFGAAGGRERSAYPAGRRGYSRSHGPLMPRPRLPKIWNVSDAELRRLWPGIDPDDIRRYAPWAVTRDEVARLVIPAGRKIQGVNLETHVERAIRAEQVARPRPPLRPVEIVAPRRAPDAFRIKRLPRSPAVPVIFDARGMPITPPPSPMAVTSRTIAKQLDWCKIAVSSVVTAENLSPILDPAGRALATHSRREMSRLLGINLREGVPGLQALIDQWRDHNVHLIETGLWADRMRPQLRPSMLADVSAVVEQAHAQGLRVEYIAGELQERFGVSDSRAELLARDQVLKLNGQINQQRQRAVGVRQYRWRTSGDERVRERHAELNNSIQSWDAPPEVAPGRFEHPGGDYQCRCTASPVLPDWLENA